MTTDTTPEDIATGALETSDTAAATGARGAHECIDVDPTTLIIGDNVRAGAHLDRQFLVSLREFGVMDPIHVTRDRDGAP